MSDNVNNLLRIQAIEISYLRAALRKVESLGCCTDPLCSDCALIIKNALSSSGSKFEADFIKLNKNYKNALISIQELERKLEQVEILPQLKDVVEWAAYTTSCSDDCIEDSNPCIRCRAKQALDKIKE